MIICKWVELACTNHADVCCALFSHHLRLSLHRFLHCELYLPPPYTFQVLNVRQKQLTTVQTQISQATLAENEVCGEPDSKVSRGGDIGDVV